jgi:calcineurin-like phosphoesterase
MSGPVDSIIGVKVDSCLRRNLSQMPIKMEVADGDSEVCGALFGIDDSGHCTAVERIRVS